MLLIWFDEIDKNKGKEVNLVGGVVVLEFLVNNVVCLEVDKVLWVSVIIL